MDIEIVAKYFTRVQQYEKSSWHNVRFGGILVQVICPLWKYSDHWGQGGGVQ